MIIWLASYPKSGNTWIRTIISQILTKNLNSEKVFDTSKHIRLYPSKTDFINIDEDFKSDFLEKDKKKLFNKTALNWEISQNKIRKENKIKIFKTHNMLCKLKIENKICSFTNLENSLGVIHIIRDPRNVVSSLKNHFSFENYHETFNFLKNENQTLGIDENKIPQLLSSWKNHYNSWKRYPKNNLLIKYEDLILNIEKEINKIAIYLKNFFEISIDDSEIEQIILNSSFENLRNLEKKGLFNENAQDIKTGKIKDFFNLGRDNNWQQLLSSEIINLIEIEFKDEMKELGYL